MVMSPLMGARSSVIGLKAMLDSVEPFGDHAEMSVPFVKKSKKYLALPGAARAELGFNRFRNGAQRVAKAALRTKSLRLKLPTRIPFIPGSLILHASREGRRMQ